MSTTITTTEFDGSIADYLERQRALGRAYVAEEHTLRSLRDFICSADKRDVDLASFERWCASHASLSGNVRRNRQRIVRNWCLYRQRAEPLCFVPDPNRFPKPNPHIAPVIIAPVAVSRMLTAARSVKPTPDSALRPDVLRLATVLLYTAGLRRGELLRLQLGDVNAQDAVLRVRESKFHKSRWVPLSKEAGAELREYISRRQQQWGMAATAQPLLCHGTRHCHGYTGTGLSTGLQELIEAANVRGWDGRRPRVHDFRHYPVSRNIPSNVGGTLAAGGIRCNMTDLLSAYSMASELLEKGEQLVIGSKAADPPTLRFNLIQSGLLHLQICIKINLCRLN